MAAGDARFMASRIWRIIGVIGVLFLIGVLAGDPLLWITDPSQAFSNAGQNASPLWSAALGGK